MSFQCQLSIHHWSMLGITVLHLRIRRISALISALILPLCACFCPVFLSVPFERIIVPLLIKMGLPGWLSDKESACQCRLQGSKPWVRKILWRSKWQPTPVFLLGKFHGQRSLAGYTVHRVTKNQTWLGSWAHTLTLLKIDLNIWLALAKKMWLQHCTLSSSQSFKSYMWFHHCPFTSAMQTRQSYSFSLGPRIKEIWGTVKGILLPPRTWVRSRHFSL